MHCPHCMAPMIREDDRDYSEISKRDKPAATYYCPECDSEWEWIMGVPGLKKLDGSDASEKPEVKGPEEE